MPKHTLSAEGLAILIQNSKVAHLNTHIPIIKEQSKKKHKYGAKRVTVDYIDFASTREANRYTELKLMLQANLIKDLKLQVPYDLNPGGTHIIRYIADFVYVDNNTGLTIVEDCKGFRTKEYQKKKKLMMKVHNIQILET